MDPSHHLVDCRWILGIFSSSPQENHGFRSQRSAWLIGLLVEVELKLMLLMREKKKKKFSFQGGLKVIEIDQGSSQVLGLVSYRR